MLTSQKLIRHPECLFDEKKHTSLEDCCAERCRLLDTFDCRHFIDVVSVLQQNHII